MTSPRVPKKKPQKHENPTPLPNPKREPIKEPVKIPQEEPVQVENLEGILYINYSSLPNCTDYQKSRKYF